MQDVKEAFQSHPLTFQNTFYHWSFATAHCTQCPGRKGSHIYSCQPVLGREQGRCRRAKVHTMAVVLCKAAAQGDGQLVESLIHYFSWPVRSDDAAQNV